MSIQESIYFISNALAAIYEPSEAEIIAQWLLESITGLAPTAMRLQKDQLLTAAQEATMHRYLEELQQHRPVQYVLGESYFYGYPFYVDEAVLIPRPETEELVQKVLAYIDHKYSATEPVRILEVGTGSGCISIALQKKVAQSQVTGLDISEEALVVARRNAASLGATVTFVRADFLEEASWEALGTFDLVVSNPPYITLPEKEAMHTHVLSREPHLALFVSDNDPQQFYRKIETFAHKYLRKDGAVFLELNQSFAHDTQDLYNRNGWKTDLYKDLNDNERMLVCYR
ncbi:peptide chain release factor N(5)-glutamine methyltransferase [Taibaiella sp. KBW10]|uniref:peptide chain release factor N(5)-glutamine methyltransferase n=1 Tax=Taibaiella sp. KBW10 TaxID=2153357 RepID=UPI000F5B3259|nr:peptide chain release factor N(5)-glutamine methyltransferase [Taibaiella sp. KBW10]RQO31418.1 peptide chain release factor N(5)-glutamine methyltransferase [Taibaiella sp. KBW10]